MYVEMASAVSDTERQLDSGTRPPTARREMLESSKPLNHRLEEVRILLSQHVPGKNVTFPTPHPLSLSHTLLLN